MSAFSVAIVTQPDSMLEVASEDSKAAMAGEGDDGVTVVCVSVDPFLQNTAPIRSSFGCIGVQHPGISPSAGSLIDLKQVGNRPSHLIFGLQGHRRLSMHARGMSSGLTIGMGYAQGTVISGLQRTHVDDRDGRKPKISHVESQYSHVEDSRKSTTI